MCIYSMYVSLLHACVLCVLWIYGETGKANPNPPFLEILDAVINKAIICKSVMDPLKGNVNQSQPMGSQH